MTRVRFSRSGDRYELVAAGHATGSKEVCAAISGIIYALAGYAVNADGVAADELRLASGDAKIAARGGEGLRAAFDMAEIGIRQIEGKYGECVRVEG